MVYHHRYDPQRRERRPVLVAAFDNEPEQWACMNRVSAGIKARRQRGERVDPVEHASGSVHEPGYLRRAAHAHLLRRATEHGVWGSWIDDLELPSSIAVLRSQRDPQ